MKRAAPPGTPLGLRLAATMCLIGEAAPFAPATFASLAMVPLLFGYLFWPVWMQVAASAVVMWLAILVCDRAERCYGHDASAIVLDEVAGMFVTMIALPVAVLPGGPWTTLLIGFVFFRLFDVLKPFPAGWAQDLKGGKGVVLDDIFAAIYANLATQIAVRVLG